MDNLLGAKKDGRVLWILGLATEWNHLRNLKKKKKKVTINPRDPNSGIWDEAQVFS